MQRAFTATVVRVYKIIMLNALKTQPINQFKNDRWTHETRDHLCFK